MKNSFYFVLVFTVLYASIQGQIIVDESYDDWSSLDISAEDPLGDGAANGLDFGNVYISNDDTYLFVRIELNKVINIQDNNNLSVNIDIDNNSSTGFQLGGLGAEIRYFFGSRTGNVKVNDQISQINHKAIGLVTLPSVTSSQFEIAIKRTNNDQNPVLNMSSSIRLFFEDDVTNGDVVPDQTGGILYTFKTDTPPLAPYQINKLNEDHFRLVSYNALFDNIFDPGPSASFSRILEVLNPDVIGFQEIYDHSINETGILVSSILNEGVWFGAEAGPDIKLLSRYPIKASDNVDGNGIFLLSVKGKDVVIFNAHLPCCDNESGRQAEVDNLMSYLRKSRDGEEEIQIELNTPIFIIGDMNLVGKREQQQTLITGNIQQESVYGPDFRPDWDESDLEDAVPLATGSPLAVTWGTNGSFSPGRLDYMLYSGSVMQLRNSYALNTGTLKDEELASFSLLRSDTEMTSDHFPVVGDFTINGINASNELSFNPEINLLPNPAHDFLEINSSQIITKVVVLDNIGKTIYNKSEKSDKIHLDIRHYQAGIYYAIIHFDGNQITRQFIVN